MRQINIAEITDTVADLFLEANYVMSEDVTQAITGFLAKESSPIGSSVLDQILRNNQIAASERIAICQDTGMAVVFVKLGQEVQIVGGSFNQAINDGVARAYNEGYLRKSIVDDPIFERKNTQTNTPAVIHLELVEGDELEITAVAKGFGSENMSVLAMLTPAQGVEGVKRVVLDAAAKAGPNPCPPTVIGVGVGGTMEKAALLAKQATIRELGSRNPNPMYAALEEELLTEINKLGIGPSGTGGNTTSIGVNIEYYPTHIAGLPVAVNVCCHAVRHASRVL